MFMLPPLMLSYRYVWVIDLGSLNMGLAEFHLMWPYIKEVPDDDLT
jgi:hypothetical protein